MKNFFAWKKRFLSDRKLSPEMKKARDGGFTFVETLAVLAVTALLASQTGTVVSALVQKAKKASAKTQISSFQAALQSYYIDCGSFPTQEQGLKALVSKPDLIPVPSNWQGPYISSSLPKDPWGEDYVYLTKNSPLMPDDAPEGLPFAIYSNGGNNENGKSAQAVVASWR